jgi:GNAT superfamily N-acetyltransferase
MSTTALPPGNVAMVPFAKEHLQGALRLSQEMSWPYRLEDWAIALELGQGLVLLDRAGTVVATAAWWPYGEAHASAGMIIVAKAEQGRGHGARLMEALLAAARPRTITLNSTAEGLALYGRRGFVPVGLIRQHQGIPGGLGQMRSHRDVRSMSSSDSQAVARLDRQASGWDRQAMLHRLRQAGGGHVLMRDGEPRGFAISRPFGFGHVIGPVVAEHADDARALIEAAIARLGEVFVRVDTAASTGLGPWLEGLGLHQAGEATTMVKGSTRPPAGPARMFALANQSFN